MVVGLSAKNNVLSNTIPLDNSTKSGRIVLLMENVAARFNSTIYRTNLVKCPPMGEDGKLRYPSSFEITDCFPNLLHEIEIIQPKLVVLFGKIVQSAFKNYFASQLMLVLKSILKINFLIQGGNFTVHIIHHT